MNAIPVVTYLLQDHFQHLIDVFPIAAEFVFKSLTFCQQIWVIWRPLESFNSPLAKVQKDRPLCLKYLLTKREKEVLQKLKKDYKKRYGEDPEKDPDLVIYLGDSAERRSWSAASGRIPTLRMSGGLMWGVQLSRFLTGREKLATLGFPVTSKIARKMRVKVLPLTDIKRCSKIAGNCMHWSSIGVIQLIALVSFRFSGK